MPEPALLSILVLTKDEELNLPVLLDSLAGLEAKVWVVDSGSTDRTLEIARGFGCEVRHHPFESQARQVNWAIGHLPWDTPWIMRMDADERFTPELVAELGGRLRMAPAGVTGFMVKRRVHFWGRWIRHGGYYPVWLLRVWRHGRARCEDRWMDEHMLVDGGEVGRLDHDIIDENHKGLGFWIDKHNRYADREVEDLLRARSASAVTCLTGQARQQRWLKDRVYGRAPLFWRAFLYWLFRYFLQGGCLDGRAGLVFHFLQGLWYRLLVDAKLVERRRRDRIASSSGARLDQLDAPRHRNSTV